MPAGVGFVAPCDQDDVWHPEKLAVLTGALETTGALLAYSDLRIVRPDGTVLSETYWTDRSGAAGGLGDLLATNVVTGAASVLRREVLDVALPFPREVDGSYHDHWLALCALALGDLAYVARPLVDYVQHGANLVGHAERRARGPRTERAPIGQRARRDRERHVVRPQVMARTLLERAGDGMPAAKRRAAERAARGDAAWPDVARARSPSPCASRPARGARSTPAAAPPAARCGAVSSEGEVAEPKHRCRVRTVSGSHTRRTQGAAPTMQERSCPTPSRSTRRT